MKAASALSLLVVAEAALALHIPVSRVKPRVPLSPSLERRGYAVLATSGAPELKNANNNIYTSKMRIKGRDVIMQVDTGSSDTWLYPSQDKQDLFTDAVIHRDIPIKLSYGRGSVSGYVTQMTVDFAGYTVRNQSLLLVQEHQDMSLIESNLSDGLLGLGFDTLSRISNEVSAATNQNWGRTLLSNIFTSDPTTPNHIAFRLDRIWDGNNTDVGAFDIGSYAPGLEAIKDTAQIPIFSSSLQQKLYWNVLVDGVSINGKPQTLTSSVRGQQVPPAGKAAALLDTGYSLPQISPALAHTLYTAMGGVLLQDGTNTTYAVPCTAEAELVFQIGGHTIPIHPLDLTLVQTIKTTDDEIFTVCFNAFQPFSSNAGAGQLDYILGDSFLRNVYSLYDFGDFVQGLSGITQGNPYIKLLPLTDATAASAEFKTARAAQLNAPGMPHQLDPTTVNGKIRELRGTGGTNNNGAGRTGWSWLVVGFAGFIGAWISS